MAYHQAELFSGTPSAEYPTCSMVEARRQAQPRRTRPLGLRVSLRPGRAEFQQSSSLHNRIPLEEQVRGHDRSASRRRQRRDGDIGEHHTDHTGVGAVAQRQQTHLQSGWQRDGLRHIQRRPRGAVVR
jgi:hypothetical protein